MRLIHWIKEELSPHIPYLDLAEGADLDDNGRIEGAERTDLDGDGEVDPSEWQRFMVDNRAALERLGGHFRPYYSAGTAFRPDNPIHDLLSIESEIASPENIEATYRKMEEILCIVRERLSGSKLEPKWKLKLVYDSIEQANIKLDEHAGSSSFVTNIKDGVLDCDTSSLAVLAIAHELNWPVHLVKVPTHAFLRWDDGEGTRFDIDYGKFTSDDYYINRFAISQESIDRGVYLTDRDDAELLSYLYWVSANAKYENAQHGNGRYEDAVKDYDRAIELDPNNSAAYLNRGTAHITLRRYERALEDSEHALELDPSYAPHHYNRGKALHALERYEEAVAEYDRAIAIDPDHRAAQELRKIAKRSLENARREAMARQKASTR